MSPRLVRIALVVLALLAGSAFAAPLAIVASTDGDAALVRDTARSAATEGLRLRADDIVHTGSGTRLVRIEFADGAALELGPDTQVLLPAGGSRAVYIAQGWVRLTAAKGRALSAGSPRLELVALDGSAVLRIGRDLSAAFVETGHAELLDRRHGHAAPAASVPAPQAWVLRGNDAPAMQSRTPAELLAPLPRGLASPVALTDTTASRRPR